MCLLLPLSCSCSVSSPCLLPTPTTPFSLLLSSPYPLLFSYFFPLSPCSAHCLCACTHLTTYHLPPWSEIQWSVSGMGREWELWEGWGAPAFFLSRHGWWEAERRGHRPRLCLEPYLSIKQLWHFTPPLAGCLPLSPIHLLLAFPTTTYCTYYTLLLPVIGRHTLFSVAMNYDPASLVECSKILP